MMDVSDGPLVEAGVAHACEEARDEEGWISDDQIAALFRTKFAEEFLSDDRILFVSPAESLYILSLWYCSRYKELERAVSLMFFAASGNARLGVIFPLSDEDGYGGLENGGKHWFLLSMHLQFGGEEHSSSPYIRALYFDSLRQFWGTCEDESECEPASCLPPPAEAMVGAVRHCLISRMGACMAEHHQVPVPQQGNLIDCGVCVTLFGLEVARVLHDGLGVLRKWREELEAC